MILRVGIARVRKETGTAAVFHLDGPSGSVCSSRLVFFFMIAAPIVSNIFFLEGSRKYAIRCQSLRETTSIRSIFEQSSLTPRAHTFVWPGSLLKTRSVPRAFPHIVAS